MDPTPITPRLFHCLPSPAERAEVRARNRGAQASMFEVVVEVVAVFSCAACGAADEVACSCSRTGAVALQLVDVFHDYCPPIPGFRGCRLCGRDANASVHDTSDRAERNTP